MLRRLSRLLEDDKTVFDRPIEAIAPTSSRYTSLVSPISQPVCYSTIRIGEPSSGNSAYESEQLTRSGGASPADGSSSNKSPGAEMKQTARASACR